MGGKVRVSRLELRILDALWTIGRGSVREVLEAFEARPGGQNLAYTTVQTLMARLEEKRAVRRIRKIGNANVFEPVLGRGDVRHAIVRDILDAFGGSARPLVAHLVEAGALTLEDLRAIERTARDESQRGQAEPRPGTKKRRGRAGRRRD
jgi:predicted transcriptional regulator